MLRRFFHNFLNSLRKDSGAHFTYNLGVGFVRVGVLLLLAAAVLFVCSFIHPGVSLECIGETDARLMGIWRVNDAFTGIEVIDDAFPTYRYYFVVKYCFSYSEYDYDNEHEHSCYITREMFEEYVDLDLESVIHLNIYENVSELNYYPGYFFSPDGTAKAEQEMRRANPTTLVSGSSVFWVLMLAFPVLLIGFGEERLAMKYPRSDVVIGETALVLSEEDTDDLMDEFNREYSKYHRDWLADPPEYDHPRGDHGNDLFRIGRNGGE